MKVKAFFRKIRGMGFATAFQKLIGYEAVFTIAVRQKTGKDTIPEMKSPFIEFDYSKQFWYADPLLFSHTDRECIFMEAFDREAGLGRIAFSENTENGWTVPKVIIEEKFHLSYPMIFQYKQEIYMMPETSTAETVTLYHCVKFPEKWEKQQTFLEGRRIVDIVVKDINKNEIQFVGSVCSPDNDLMTKFCSFSLKEEDGMFTASEELEFNRCQDYTWYSRCAGYPYFDLLPLQRSREGIYGYSIIFAERDAAMKSGTVVKKAEITPSDVKIVGKKPGKIIGIHTYTNSLEHEVIDVEYMKYNPSKWRNRLKKIFGKG
ncbi:hypothetical protein [Eisenbergiella tayi]|uniref:Glucosamine inositolphosphorylceramide transferase 1 N-terminal domain-containing protein n=1 Tax=Eisenbergiella tayi TaxID=1432052 RepID=A0A1E3AAF0_9FIRM|nr:hypothetical protein [Eisenbergiella tayi]ODM05609.1 hypothetical protein BEI61_01498 [Eisenbergiella tayi]